MLKLDFKPDFLRNNLFLMPIQFNERREGI